MQIIDAIGRSLQQVPVFADLSADYHQLVAGCGALSVFQSGETIYREGAAADSFYVIRRGRVRLEAHVPGRPPCIVDSLGAGEPLGGSWLVPPYRLQFDAKALELTRLIRFDAACLRRKMADDPRFACAIYERLVPVIVGRLAEARRQLMDLYGQPAGRSQAWR